MNGNSTGILLDLHQIIDLSEEGMSFQCSGPMDIGETLNLSVDLSNPKTYFHTSGRVVWSNPTGRTGIRFQKTATEDTVKLREWLFANALAGTLPEDQTSQVIEDPIPIDSFRDDLPEAPVANEPRAPFRSHLSSLLATEAVKQEVESLAFDLDSALQIVVERALSLSRATGAAIALSDGDDMLCRATSGPDAPPLGARLQVGSGFSGECVRTGQLLHCDDSEVDERVDRESCRTLDIRSIMAAPIRSSDRVIGLIEIFSPEAGVFGDSDKVVLQSLAEIVLNAVQRAIEDVDSSNPRPPANSVSKAASVTSVGSSRQPQQELIRNPEAAIPERIAPGLGLEAPATLKSAKVPWIWVGALVAAILVALGLVVSEWGSTPQRSNSQPPVGPPTTELNRQPEVERNSLSDLKQLATKGDALAQFTVGLRYAIGSDAPQDYGEAARWFSMAAEQGHVLAQSTLGAYYWAGRGVPQDFRKAYYWALLAQAAGDDSSRARVQFLVPRLSHEDMVTVQHQASDWLKQHRPAGKPTPVRQ